MLERRRLCFIGSGNMGEALVRGILKKFLCRPEQIFCTDVKPERQKAMSERYGVNVSADNAEVTRQSDIVILSVKPQIFKQVIGEIAPFLDDSKLVISIAAGVSMEAIELCAGRSLRLIRVMPNICASVGEGVSAISSNSRVSDEDLQVVMAIFGSVGKTILLEEDLLDAVTGLSGSGPAYVFLIVDALADAGVKVGLTRGDALVMAAQTVLGAARMLVETGEHPGRLKDSVASPGGTAIAGLHVLETGGVRSWLISAVEAATERSRVLGRILHESLTKKS